jgi:electron transfer flavoprotein beta subunit
MKVLVPVKRVIDYNVKVRVKADGSGVDLANVKMSMNPFDEIAVEEAIRLKEKGIATEIVVVSIGVKQSQETLRNALAMGADRAILIEATDNVHVDIEPLAVAKLLAAVVKEEAPGLVLCGKQAIDNDMNATGQMLSALLGWSQATFASEVAIEGDQCQGHPRSGRRVADDHGQAADDHHRRPAPERAALCLAAEHHEGQGQAAGDQDARRLRR